MRDNDADLTEDFIHRLLLSASLWIPSLLTLTRLLVRNFNRLTLVIRLSTLIASSNTHLDVSTPSQSWWKLLVHHPVIMILTATGPPEKNNDLVRKGHDRMLPRMLFFSPGPARVV
jgi:hypothetical protein